MMIDQTNIPDPPILVVDASDEVEDDALAHMRHLADIIMQAEKVYPVSIRVHPPLEITVGGYGDVIEAKDFRSVKALRAAIQINEFMIAQVAKTILSDVTREMPTNTDRHTLVFYPGFCTALYMDSALDPAEAIQDALSRDIPLLFSKQPSDEEVKNARQSYKDHFLAPITNFRTS